MPDKTESNITNTAVLVSKTDALAKVTAVRAVGRPASESFQQTDEFTREADEPPMGLIAEVWDFLKHEKKWWLTPIIIVLLFLGGLILLTSSSAIAPFIYPLF